jgi:hypothetical protein
VSSDESIETEKRHEEEQAKTAKPEDFADMRFFKELDESGFIDDLNKRNKR